VVSADATSEPAPGPVRPMWPDCGPPDNASSGTSTHPRSHRTHSRVQRSHSRPGGLARKDRDRRLRTWWENATPGQLVRAILDTMHSRALKRVGVVLFAVGAIAIAMTIAVVTEARPYSAAFDVAAMLAGTFLWRGGPRAALWTRSLTVFLLAAGVATLVAAPFFQPLDLTVTQIRLNPAGFGMNAAVGLFVLGLLLWITLELGRPPVLEAMGYPHPRASRRRPRRADRSLTVAHSAWAVGGTRDVTRAPTAWSWLSLPSELDQQRQQRPWHIRHRGGHRVEHQGDKAGPATLGDTVNSRGSEHRSSMSPQFALLTWFPVGAACVLPSVRRKDDSDEWVGTSHPSDELQQNCLEPSVDRAGRRT